MLAAAVTGATALAAQSARSAEEKPRGFIDAHVHVWTDDVAKYPLASGWTAEQMEPKSFTAEQLFEHAKPCGVGRVVLIQMSFYGFDNSYMLDTMGRHPGVFSGVAVIDDKQQPAETMRKLAERGVRGFRIHPGKQKVDTWISSSGMAAMWKCGGESKLAMCCLVNPEALPAIDQMCAKYPGTPVVIDHFARIGMDGPIGQADVDNLCRLARHKHTRVKVSAYYALGAKKAPYKDLGLMIRRLVDAFGRERLMWASDCPFQVQEGHTYRDSIELVRSRLDFLSDEDRQWLLAKTAEKTFFG
jgi:predicted TIM-barrel fold metal-dependent hydrolase